MKRKNNLSASLGKDKTELEKSRLKSDLMSIATQIINKRRQNMHRKNIEQLKSQTHRS